MSDSRANALITREQREAVAILRLNDPGRLNALSVEMRRELWDALRVIESDPETRAVVLTGEGRAFCSGGAMGPNLVETPTDWIDFYHEVYGLMDYMHNFPKPIIAAVNGMCYAAGMILVKYCDFVVASENASFCYIEARAGMGGVGTAIHTVGPQWAKFLILTGEEITAKRAEDIGLTLMTTVPDELLDVCVRIGERIASAPAHVTALNKRHVNAELDAAGWYATRDVSSLFYAVLNASLPQVKASDGRELLDVLRQDGLRAFIRERDSAYKTPLLPW